ncbi:MAG TPA: hypothetical protein VEY89_00395 [Candidatus Dormibacteraeota bacterium]|nr:hypothetical protein [Candidatus Dormibacteraeota bacterium]
MRGVPGLLLTTGLAAAAVLHAADLLDPAIGTWRLNVARSAGNNLPQSEIRTFATSGDMVVLTFKRVGTDGKEMSVQTRYRLDGKDYPITGSRDYDTLNARRIAANTVQSTQKLAGKTVGTSTRSVSADGKTMTLTGRRTNAQGEVITTTLIYDRQ